MQDSEGIDWSIPSLVSRYITVFTFGGSVARVYRFREGYYWKIHLVDNYFTSELHSSYSECMTDLKLSLEEMGMKFNWWQVCFVDCRGYGYATN